MVQESIFLRAQVKLSYTTAKIGYRGYRRRRFS